MADTAANRSVINAYNGPIPGGGTVSERLTSAYVFSVGSTAYAMAYELDGLYTFFDRSYAWLAGVVAMR